MPKSAIIAVAALLIGLSVGGAGVGIFLSTRQKEVVAEKRAPEGRAEVPPVDSQKPPKDEPQWKENKAEPPTVKVWKPEPGEECRIVMPTSLAMDGQDGTTMRLIPLDTLALDRLLKYGRARDGAGFVDLLHEKRAVWTALEEINVKVITVDDRHQIADVRVEANVYKAKYSIGRVSKVDCQLVSGVEAAVPLEWLRSGRVKW